MADWRARCYVGTLAATAGVGSAYGQTVGRCQMGDPTGYFTGIAVSRQSGRLEVSLNLRCTGGRFGGALVTPVGTFAITGGQAHSSRLRLLFEAGDEAGTIEATVSSDALQGTFAVSGDSGAVALRLIGEARSVRWDAPTLDLDAARWHADLAFFAREIVARHGNAFHSLARARFDSLVATLDRRLSNPQW